VDVFTAQKRSEVMAKIRGRGNLATELALLQLLRDARISGWRRHLPLPGRPDFAFSRARVAIFVDGCFWHGCPIHFTRPKNRADFWEGKIARNRKRDRRVDRKLRSLGWKVLRVWEHDLNARSRPKVLVRVMKAIAAAKAADAATGLRAPSTHLRAQG
jgi:DNA mismatch endonuclease (patch repair protein)